MSAAFEGLRWVVIDGATMMVIYQMAMPPVRLLSLEVVVDLNRVPAVIHPHRRHFERKIRFQLNGGRTTEAGGAEAGVQPWRQMLLQVVQETRGLPHRLDPRG